MKNKIALFLSAVSVLSAPLAAGCSPSKEPSQDETKKKEIAMDGERMDNRMSDRANRDAEDGNTQGEQNMENREQNADTRQDNREDRR